MKFIQINPTDNVAVAMQQLSEGEKIVVGGKEIAVKNDIPAGHKIALQDFKEGNNIIKYGFPIGHAREAISCGSWVNEKNIKNKP